MKIPFYGSRVTRNSSCLRVLAGLKCLGDRYGGLVLGIKLHLGPICINIKKFMLQGRFRV